MKFEEYFIMQLLRMPLFEVFLPIIQSNSIHNWTANDFWKRMKLSKKERHRFNRQRMYRILRKLVEFGFLDKELNQQHPRFSLFNETPKINEIRLLNVNIIDSSPLVPFKSSPLDTLKNKQVNLRHIYKGSPNSYQHGYKISKIL